MSKRRSGALIGAGFGLALTTGAAVTGEATAPTADEITRNKQGAIELCIGVLQPEETTTFDAFPDECEGVRRDIRYTIHEELEHEPGDPSIEIATGPEISTNFVLPSADSLRLLRKTVDTAGKAEHKDESEGRRVVTGLFGAVAIAASTSFGSLIGKELEMRDKKKAAKK